MNDKYLLRLLEIVKRLEMKSNQLMVLFQGDGFVDDIMDDVGDLILDMMGIPEDNTTEHSTNHEVDWEAEGLFCRDGFYHILYDDELEPKEKLQELKKCKDEFDV